MSPTNDPSPAWAHQNEGGTFYAAFALPDGFGHTFRWLIWFDGGGVSNKKKRKNSQYSLARDQIPTLCRPLFIWRLHFMRLYRPCLCFSVDF